MLKHIILCGVNGICLILTFKMFMFLQNFINVFDEKLYVLCELYEMGKPMNDLCSVCKL